MSAPLGGLPDHLRCTATARRTGERCQNPRIRGGDVCRTHGGAAPQVRAAAAARLREQALREAAKQIAVPVDTSPDQALLDEVCRSAGMVAYYQARVQELDRDALVWGRVKEKTGGEDYGTTSEAGPHVWLKLYAEERDRLVRVCAVALKAGIEERRVRVAEQQGVLLAAVIRRVLDRLDLTEAQAALVSTVVPEELRALEAA